MKYEYTKFKVFNITKTLNLFFFFCIMLLVTSSYGQVTQTLTSSGTFVVPCDVTSVTVKVWGAGGAGGGSSSNNKGGEGGGAGGYSYGVIPVSGGQIINYTIGNGGVGGTGNGGNGGDSNFLTLNAYGGKGGDQNGNSAAKGFGGSASGGSINTSGADGGSGGNNSVGNGGNASNGGTGGLGVFNGDGNDGNAAGGGGGGGEKTGGSNNKGGNGGRGEIQISYSSTYKTYCEPSFNWAVSPITNVTFAGINNTTSNSTSSTSMEQFCITGSVVQGSVTNPISTKGNTVGPYVQSVYAFVDWDQNGVFGNKSNEIYNLGSISNSTGVDAVVLNSNISVPSSALLGNTRMRVIQRDNNSADACFAANDYGQAEDYTITVTSPCITYSLTAVSATNSCASSGTSTVDVTSTTSGLPIGNYTVEYRLSYNSYSTVYTAPMSVTTAGVGTFTADVSIVNVNSSTKIKIYKLTSAACTTTLSSNNESNISYKKPSLGKPGINSGYAACSIWKAQWNNESADGYYLDVATTNTFTAGTFLSGYENLQIVGYPSSYDITGVTPGNTYYYRVRSYNYCGTSINSNVVSFVAGGAVAPAISTIAQPSCASSTGSFTITNYVSWYSYTISPSLGVVRSNAVVTAPQGNYTISVTYSGCTSAPTSFTINNQPALPATPSIGTITSEKCNTLGSVVLNGLPSSGTINQSGKATASYPITGTSMTITNLAAGNYTFSVSNGSCTSAVTSSIEITPSNTNTWNGTTWSNGTPTINDKIVFAGNYPPAVDPNVDISGCSCMVTGGANVTIKSGKNLTISNEVTVVGSGSLTFEDTASLVQINNAAVNSGNIKYNRLTSSVLKSDYTYWSSPVFNQSLNISSSYASGLFYSYDDFATPENWKKESSSTIMQVGKGYIIRGSLTGSQTVPGLYNATFVGVPNNGIKTLAIGPIGTSNLIGNPYPSALDADLFLAANTSVIEGTIYIWTHKTAIQSSLNITAGKAGTGSLAYTSDDYATYNGVGGVAVSGGIKPTGKIAAGQAFFTTSTATASSVIFNNTMRLAGTTLANGKGVNQQFFKTKNSKTEKVIEKNRIWLNLTNSEGAFKQTLVGYLTDATNDYDNRFDGQSFDGNAFIDFYSINNDKNLTIQGRALPFDEKDEVPLGYTTTINGLFTIKIDQVDGVLTNQAVFLEDKLSNTIFDLKSGNYTFSTVPGTFNDRFVLRYTNKTLGTNDFNTTESKVVISVKSKQITVNAFADTIKKVSVYDLLGRQIYIKENVNSSSLILSDLNISHQALLVKTTLENGTTQTDKIIY